MSMQPPKKTSGKAIASLILGLLSFCVPFLLSLAAVIFAFLAFADIRSGRAKGGALAGIGLFFGFVSMFCGVGYGVGGYFAWQGISISISHNASRNNLRLIGIAMHDYHDTHQGLPQQAIVSKKGEPLLSWRVAILPFIEQGHTYKQMRMDEPWDSPHNKQFLKRMPRIYVNPLEPESAKEGKTYYQVFYSDQGNANPIFVRDTRQMNRVRGTALTQIHDGTSNTIMAVESSTPVFWTKPDDIRYDSRRPVPKLGVSQFGFNVLLADGSVFALNRSQLSDRTLHLMIQRDDGRPVNFPR